MAERVLRNIETGGEGESRRGREDQPLSWRDKLRQKLKRKHESSEDGVSEVPKESVSFTEFFRGIFKDEKPSQERTSWIDRAFDEREQKKERTSEEQASPEIQFESLPEQEKTEFYAVVAQRFKDAGERFLSFIGRTNSPEEDTQITDAVDDTEVPERSEIEQAPPFDFVRRNLREQFDRSVPDVEDIDDDPHVSDELENYDDEPSHREGPVVDRYVPIDARRINTPEVETYEFRSSKRNLIAAAIVGATGSSRYEKMRAERKIAKQDRKLRAQSREIEELERDQQELGRDFEKLEKEVKARSLKIRHSVEQSATQQQNNIEKPSETGRAAKERDYKHEEPEVREVSYQDLKPRQPDATSSVESKQDIAKESKFVEHEISEERRPESSQKTYRASGVIGSGVEQRTVPQSFESRLQNPEVRSAENIDDRLIESSPKAAVSVQEILKERQTVEASPPTVPFNERVKEQYSLDEPHGVNTWIATGVVLALVFLSILFAVAS